MSFSFKGRVLIERISAFLLWLLESNVRVAVEWDGSTRIIEHNSLLLDSVGSTHYVLLSKLIGPCQSKLLVNLPLLGRSISYLEDSWVLCWVHQSQVIVSVKFIQLNNTLQVINLATVGSPKFVLSILFLLGFPPMFDSMLVNLIQLLVAHRIDVHVLVKEHVVMVPTHVTLAVN